MSSAPLISSRNKSRFPHPVKVIGIVVIILIFTQFIFPRFLPSLTTSIIRPLWSMEVNVTSQDKMIDELNRTIEINEARYHQSASIQKENEDLKVQLGRSVASRPLLAQILKKPPFTAYDAFILDIGEQHGVKKGDMVYALGNIPIGEIVETETNTSKVKLYSSSGERFNIMVGSSSIEATALGKGGGYFETSLPRDAKISKGDAVIIPRLKNAFAGTVEAIISDPSEPFSTVLFHQPINIYELRWVLVDLESKENKQLKNDKK